MPTTPDDYRQAEAFLRQIDPDWSGHIETIGPCRHAPKPAREPYEALVRAIAYQQLHARAGDAILARLLACFPASGFPTPAQLLAASDGHLRGCGFSARKVATLRAIAQATAEGWVPNRATALTLTDEALVERLTALPGVGRWTVEMLLIYTLERLDVLPADDFGVREGYRRLKGLNAAPTRTQMARIGLDWRPYRTVAAWYLWRVPTG